MGDLDPSSKFGQDALRQMEEDDEEEQVQEQPKAEEGGIRLGMRLGKKKGGVNRSEVHKKKLTSNAPKGMGGYDSRDVS